MNTPEKKHMARNFGLTIDGSFPKVVTLHMVGSFVVSECFPMQKKTSQISSVTVHGRNPANHPLYMKPYGKLGDSPYQLVSRISEPSTCESRGFLIPLTVNVRPHPSLSR